MLDLGEFEAKANGTFLLDKCLIKRSAPGRALILDQLQQSTIGQVNKTCGQRNTGCNKFTKLFIIQHTLWDLM